MVRAMTGSRRRGATVVEAALVMPLLVLLILGLVEYGWLFLKANQISDAAREGARTATFVGATQASVQSAVKAQMAAAGFNPITVQVAVAPTNLETVGAGEPVTVTVTVSYASLSLVHAALVPAPTNLSSSVTMAKEAP